MTITYDHHTLNVYKEHKKHKQSFYNMDLVIIDAYKNRNSDKLKNLLLSIKQPKQSNNINFICCLFENVTESINEYSLFMKLLNDREDGYYIHKNIFEEFILALLKLKTANYKEASNRFLGILCNSPDSLLIFLSLYSLGICHFYLKNNEKSIEYILSAINKFRHIEVDKYDIDTLSSVNTLKQSCFIKLGYLKILKNDFAGAAESFENASNVTFEILSIDDNDSFPYLLRTREVTKSTQNLPRTEELIFGEAIVKCGIAAITIIQQDKIEYYIRASNLIRLCLANTALPFRGAANDLLQQIVLKYVSLQNPSAVQNSESRYRTQQNGNHTFLSNCSDNKRPRL